MAEAKERPPITDPYIIGQVNSSDSWSLRLREPQLENRDSALMAWSGFFANLYRLLHRAYGISLEEVERGISALEEEMVPHIERYKWFCSQRGEPITVEQVSKDIKILTDPHVENESVKVSVMFPPVDTSATGYAIQRIFRPITKTPEPQKETAA